MCVASSCAAAADDAADARADLLGVPAALKLGGLIVGAGDLTRLRLALGGSATDALDRTGGELVAAACWLFFLNGGSG